MKNFIQLSLLLTIPLFAVSQSFIDTTKHWNVVKCSGGGVGFYCETYSYKFFGDTIVSGIVYQKLYTKKDSSTSNWTLDNLMRELGNKIYLHTTLGDKIVYDFDAEPGDTIKQLGPFFNQPMIVDSVDTVIIGGNPRKRLFFGNLSPYETWIEEIGSLYGILNTIIIHDDLIPDYSEVTLCYWKDNNLLYFDSTWNTCYFNTTSITKPDNKINVQLYPNPSGNKINLSFMLKTSSEIKIKILNITGKEVFFIPAENYSTGENKLDISVSDLPCGIYFLKLYVDDRLVTKKFLKN